MYYYLKKDGKICFTEARSNWWLTGFMLGE
jgi:hypothetical protein